MRILAKQIALFRSHDDTGYPIVLGLDMININSVTSNSEDWKSSPVLVCVIKILCKM